jgi:hypothetical protein
VLALEFIAGQAKNMGSWASRLLCGSAEEKGEIMFNLCDLILCNFAETQHHINRRLTVQYILDSLFTSHKRGDNNGLIYMVLCWGKMHFLAMFSTVQSSMSVPCITFADITLHIMAFCLLLHVTFHNITVGMDSFLLSGKYRGGLNIIITY